MKNFTTILFSMLLMATVASAQERHRVILADFKFTPDTLVVHKGDTVAWVNNSVDITHTSTSGTDCTGDGIWNSGELMAGDSFTFVFDTTGTFPYFCIPHCAGGMKALITVETVSGINENQRPAISVVITPQPIMDRAFLRFSGFDGADAVVIYNLTGKEIARTKVGYNANTAQLDLAAAQPGIYFYQIFSGTQVVYSGKLFKQ